MDGGKLVITVTRVVLALITIYLVWQVYRSADTLAALAIGK